MSPAFPIATARCFLAACDGREDQHSARAKIAVMVFQTRDTRGVRAGEPIDRGRPKSPEILTRQFGEVVAEKLVLSLSELPVTKNKLPSKSDAIPAPDIQMDDRKAFGGGTCVSRMLMCPVPVCPLGFYRLSESASQPNIQPRDRVQAKSQKLPKPTYTFPFGKQ